MNLNCLIFRQNSVKKCRLILKLLKASKGKTVALQKNC